jgi:hypothetical protein
MLVAAYTKSGGSWLRWLIMDTKSPQDFYGDLVPSAEIDKHVRKTEYILKRGGSADIHIIRHPLDIICSAVNYCHLTNRPIDTPSYIDNWITNATLRGLNEYSWKDFVKWAGSQHTIRYEDMLEDPVKIVSDFVGKDATLAVEKYDINRLRAREAGVDSNKIGRETNKKYSFFNKASKYYYDELLTPEQIARGKDKFKEEIEKYWPETL